MREDLQEALEHYSPNGFVCMFYRSGGDPEVFVSNSAGGDTLTIAGIMLKIFAEAMTRGKREDGETTI